MKTWRADVTYNELSYSQFAPAGMTAPSPPRTVDGPYEYDSSQGVNVVVHYAGSNRAWSVIAESKRLCEDVLNERIEADKRTESQVFADIQKRIRDRDRRAAYDRVNPAAYPVKFDHCDIHGHAFMVGSSTCPNCGGVIQDDGTILPPWEV